MLPSFLGMIVFSFLPIIISIAISFTNWNGLDKLSYKTLASNFVFLDNYKQILGTSEFWKVLGHTCYYIVLYIPMVLIIPDYVLYSGIDIVGSSQSDLEMGVKSPVWYIEPTAGIYWDIRSRMAYR